MKMASDPEHNPFLKQLVDSDPAVRDKALDSLRTYLTSGREFSNLELLKLWKGLYYSLYHTPFKQASALINSLTSLHVSLAVRSLPLGLAFAQAFWQTIAALLPALDRHRMDKFLTLQRRMMGAQLQGLRLRGWPEEDCALWIKMIGDRIDGPLGVGGDGARVGDGVRYHLLDILLDELEREKTPWAVSAQLKALVAALSAQRGGVGNRATEVLDDERWLELSGEKEKEPASEEDDEDEWDGIGD